jgi:hypothetical protein
VADFQKKEEEKMTFEQANEYLMVSLSNGNIDSIVAALSQVKPEIDTPELRKKISAILLTSVSVENMASELWAEIDINGETGLAAPISKTTILIALAFALAAGLVFILGKTRKHHTKGKS